MFKYLVLATVLAITPACKKKEEPAQRPAATEGSGSAAVAAGSADGSAAAGSAAEVAPAAVADHITVLASHSKPKPEDPVAVTFSKFTVTQAKFDPANLEGGTATIELDLASLATDSPKRDGHLKSPDYLDLSKFTTATISVGNVKKTDATHYTADATVKLRDTEKVYPVTFETLETTADSVKIRGEQEFSRLDFNVGKDPSDENEGVAVPLKIQVQLTLTNT